MIIFWIVFMMIDISYTAKHSHLIQYEQSFILSFFVKKTNISNAVMLTILVEILFVLFFPILFMHEFDFQLSAIIAFTSGGVHISGILQNKQFIKNHNI